MKPITVAKVDSNGELSVWQYANRWEYLCSKANAARIGMRNRLIKSLAGQSSVALNLTILGEGHVGMSGRGAPLYENLRWQPEEQPPQ